MPVTIEERVAYLEGKVEEHSKAWEDLKDMIIQLGDRINVFDQKVDRKIDALDQKLDRRTDETNNRIDDTNRHIDEINNRIDETNRRIDRLFFFILATLATSIGSLIGIIVTLTRT